MTSANVHCHAPLPLINHSAAARDRVSISTDVDGDLSQGPEEMPLGPKDENEFRVLLGRATWRLLHTMAARYPEQPDDQRKQRTSQFLDLLSHLYPCPQCAAHMRTMFAENPPQLNSQEQFSKWMCKVHNIVNERLKKPIFPCEDVDAHYDCGCELGALDEEPVTRPSDKPLHPATAV